MPGRGLYETLITEALAAELSRVDSRRLSGLDQLQPADAPDRLALHLSRILERAISKLDPKERVEVGTALARKLVDVIVNATAANELATEKLADPARVLRAVL